MLINQTNKFILDLKLDLGHKTQRPSNSQAD